MELWYLSRSSGVSFSWSSSSHADAYVVRQHEVEEDLLLAVEVGADDHLGLCSALLAGERREGVGDMGQHVEEVALLGVDDLLHLGQLLAAEAFLGEPLQELRPRVGRAPERAQFGLVLEELGQLAEEHLHELLRRHRRAVGMPERRRHHVLDGALLAVGELDLDLLPARWRAALGSRDAGSALASCGSPAFALARRSAPVAIGSPSHSGSLKCWCAFTKS